MQSTLVLNASYTPLGIVPLDRAIKHILNGRVSYADNSTRVLRSANTEIPIPYVIVLNEEVKVPYTKLRGSKFTRRGVFVRDDYKCVYCGAKATTIDHVVPQAAGGPTSWENCVASCKACNNKKADKTLSELGWTLPFTPAPPSRYLLDLTRARTAEQREVWQKYFAWHDPKFALSLT